MNDLDVLARAQDALGYQFHDETLLQTALTHSSVANTRLSSNERLEFLGDSVLGLVVCEMLFRDYDDWHEGDLTKVKSVVVSRRVCAEMADALGLADFLILGKGIAGAADMPMSLRAAAFESVIGAMFLDGGIDAARDFILRNITPHVAASTRAAEQENYKSLLQQFVQRRMSTTPRYEGLDEQGPDHSKCFEVCVVVGDQRFPSAWGPTKKEAEQEAAKRALGVLRANASD